MKVVASKKSAHQKINEEYTLMKMHLLVVGIAASLLGPLTTQSAFASPAPISTIDGLYGVNEYDTPELAISNTTTSDFTNVNLTLTGYQGENNGLVQSQTLGTIAAGTTFDYFWNGPTVAGNLFAYDYDDTGGNGAAGNPACVQGFAFCAYVGNFYVTFTATWNGKSIYSQFSPGQDPLGIGNACGNTASCFVGWEGLDPNGLAETKYDDHTAGGPDGVLANIYAGAPPPVGGPAPEPSSLVLLGTGIAGLAGAVRRKLAA